MTVAERNFDRRPRVLMGLVWAGRSVLEGVEPFGDK
jgi:hypothetical protein